MKEANMVHWLKGITLLLIILIISGCAGQRAFQQASRLEKMGQYDQAVSSYRQALTKNPEKQEYRVRLMRAQQQAAFQHMDKGDALLKKGEPEAANREFATALQFDPSLIRAEQLIESTTITIERNRQLEEADNLIKLRRFAQAKKILNALLENDPKNNRAVELLAKVNEKTASVGGYELALESDEAITLSFKDTPVRDAFVILSRLSGINFIFDEDIKNKGITLLLEESSFNQALELLLVMAELDQKILNPKTILLYPNSRDKKKQYEEQIIQTFYLSNIDAKKAVNLLRTMLQLRKVYVHEELNAIIVRDKLDTIELASQILETADRGEAEVVFDLELVEISHNDSLDMGLGLSRYGVDAGVFKNGSLVSSSLGDGNEIKALKGLDILFTLPSATFNLAKALSDSEVLASPKIRVKNKGKAKVHVGSREPVVTVTTNNGTSTDNVQYVDVGVKLDVEPNVKLDNTITTKLNLEVSSVVGRQETTNGTAVLTLSTTNATTELSLKDGEQTIIGGLIREEDSSGKSTIPFLGDLPLIGAIFGSKNDSKTKREILLSITPHIVKQLQLPEHGSNRLWSGGEDNLKAGPSLGYYFPEETLEDWKPPAATVKSVTPSPVADTQPAKQVLPAPKGLDLEGAEGVNPDLPESVSPPLPMPTPTDSAPRGMGSAEVGGEERVVLPRENIAAISSGGLIYFEGPKLVETASGFQVTVRVDEIDRLYSAPFFVTYDPKVVEFASAEEGEFLRSGSVPSLFTTSVDQRSGRIIIGMKQGVGGEGVSGGGALVTLHFRAVEPGKTTIRAERINFRNPQGKRLSIGDEAIEVEVQ